MRHYEIVLLIHPDQSEQVPAMLERYKGVVTAGGGKVHRVEDWGRRQMAYMIQKLAKAHYLCINIECSKEVLTELETGFRFNDAVLRHLTVLKDQAETTPSVMMKTVEREEARKSPPSRSAAASRTRRRRRPALGGTACPAMNRLVLSGAAGRARRACATPPPACRPSISASSTNREVTQDGQPRKVSVRDQGAGARGNHASAWPCWSSEASTALPASWVRSAMAAASCSMSPSSTDVAAPLRLLLYCSGSFSKRCDMPPPRGKGRFSKDRKPKRNTQSLLFRRKRFCRFTVTGVKQIDYKDIDTLARFHRRERQDHAGPPDRHARVLPAPADDLHQARALPGDAAVQRPAQGLRSTAMQIILLEKIANLGNLGDVVKVQGRLRAQLPDPDPGGAPRHRIGDQGVRGQARRAREGRRRQAGRRAGAGREDERPHRAHHAEGRRRRPPVRLGHQRRHRRCADPHRLQGREGAGAHAQRPAEDRRRAHRDGRRRTPTWSSKSRSSCSAKPT